MNSLDNLDQFFDAYEKATHQLRLLIPSLNESVTTSLRSHLASSQSKLDKEVYAGLPTLHNSRSLFQTLEKCTPPLGFLTQVDVSNLHARQFLSRLELVAILASVYELHSTEAAAWQAVEVLSRHTQRVIDEVYGLVNRAFLKLRIAEQMCFADSKKLMHKIGRIQSALKSKSSLFTAYEDLVSRVRLPTAHANLQCVVVDSLLVYLEHYDNWYAISSRLDIVMMRHKNFLDSKVWAAVYCRAFANWLTLRARLSTGAPPALVTDEGVENPVSSLFAAINIKTHGRTLVKFIMSHIGLQVDHCDDDKENLAPGESLYPNRLGASNISNTSVDRLHITAQDMVNLWLGSRLLLNGTLQVAELYTLLGTVKEARVYQLELLRIAQRLHNPSCAQSAICMMAYTDLISQRKWAFDLRLSQLKHIVNCIVSLDDVLKSRNLSLTNKTNKSNDEKAEEDEEESGFLKHRDRKKQPIERLCDSDGEEEYEGMATNPVVDALAGGLPEVYPVTPIEGIAVIKSSSGYPSLQTVTEILSANSGQRACDEEGVFTPFACSYKILNGCLWVWMGEVADLIRTKVIGRDHFFSALVPTSQISEEKLFSSDDLSTMLENKCSVSSCDAAVTPARPLTKAARAAARGAQATLSTPIHSTGRDDISDRFLRPPNALLRLDVSQPKDDDFIVSSKTRRGVNAAKALSAPVAIQKETIEFESVDRSRRSGRPVDLSRNARSGAEIPSSCSSSLSNHLGFSTTCFVPGREPKTSLQILRDNDVQKEVTTFCASEYCDIDDGKQLDEEVEEPVETCPAVAFRVPLPRNLKLTKKYLPRGHPHINLALPSSLHDPPETLIKAQDAFADRLYRAYSNLAAFPVPHLLRPVCQWLGLRWLGLGNQNQAARYFGQATGIAACGLFTSILSSKLKFEVCAESLRSVYAMSAPSDSTAYLSSRSNEMPPMDVVQLMLVDELGQVQTFNNYDSDGTQPATDLVTGGLGSRKRVYLIATRWTLGDSKVVCESRVIHNFSLTGLQYLKDFDDLQSRNVESMQEEDRRRFWSLRFSLDSQLKNLIDEMRSHWFTIEDLKWIKGEGDSQDCGCKRSCVLVLDRQLTFLPWEWIIWGQWDEGETKCNVPGVCRNFSISLVVGHLNLTKSHVAEFDPHSAFYVVNPEANLSHTETTFKDYFDQNFPKWDGILGRPPQAQEVLRGFTQRDLFVYLGHGNGSKCLMSAFDEGQNAKAVALIIGCSSGRPRLEGRHEAYASVFNHLITGAPTAVSLLWDVTDKDIDRFTQQFIDNWILGRDEDNTTSSSMTWKIFRATKACKLQSLVGKSVVVYGIPAVPVYRK